MKHVLNLMVAVALLAIPAWGLADIADDVKQSVVASTDELVTRLQNEKDTFYSDPDRFYLMMEESLEGAVDFRRIAARVMGRYRREASDQQKDKFVEVFKKSLFNAYGKTLVESGNFDIAVLNADVNPRDEEKATVDLEVTSSSGNKYPIIYSMYKNSDKQKWLLENVIVNGVNIGLAFRDRFEQQYAQYNGNIDQVLANWSSELEEVTQQEER